ncbi:unnamed protein product (macronuclear) [Paramecium tetraurelia]|uniref:Uncharacterized protein n=1 Tax=Paramecium tetraurelia TaxID=5888 RepID=A0CZI2_PARTE|nr:uncharacterized protein GSPATT00011772001 [Paramecium tetraurelia]CAK76199.1 unnamed protein product [Paramecium tetraurelia]|eukprot:XP_001443596.1 hypothetical protein (macronuclear) [Paramecium tetraurelia strain d4-2]
MLIAVVSTTFGVFLISGLGAYLTRKKIINKQLTNQLSCLTENLFTPALIFTSFQKTLTLETIYLYIPCIIITLLCLILGYVAGILSNKYWIKEKALKSVIILACANPHTTNLQLQLCYGLSNYFAKITGQPQKQLEQRLITTVIIQTVVVNSIRWSIGKSILEQHENNQSDLEMTNLSVPQSHQLTLPLSQQQQTKPENESQKKSFWNPPLYATLVSIVFICIPGLQATLLENQIIYNAIFLPLQTISRATSPIILLILGSSLYQIYFENQERVEKYSTILYIAFNRLLLMPIIGIFIVIIVQSQKIINDQCQLFMIFLTFCTPPSINILMLAKQYLQSAEEIVAVILLNSYLISIITLPLWMITYMIFFI